MIGKIINSTKGKPCSCPPHKTCSGCKRNHVRPQVYIADEGRLPVPIKITHYRSKKPVVHVKEKKTDTKYKEKNLKKGPKVKEEEVIKYKEKIPKFKKEKLQKEKIPEEEKKVTERKKKERRLIQEQSYYSHFEDKPRKVREEKVKERKDSVFNEDSITYPYEEKKRNTYEYEYLEAPRRTSRLSEWYRRRRAINDLKSYYKQERKQEKKNRLERENARRLKEEELFRQLHESKPKPGAKKKQVLAKPQADSRYVSVRKSNHRVDITQRFVNCCYRLCCQLYCCLTCVFIIGFVVIIVF